MSAAVAQDLVRQLQPIMQLPHVKEAFGRDLTAETAIGGAISDPSGTKKALETAIQETNETFSATDNEELMTFGTQVANNDREAVARYTTMSDAQKNKVFEAMGAGETQPPEEGAAFPDFETLSKRQKRVETLDQNNPMVKDYLATGDDRILTVLGSGDTAVSPDPDAIVPDIRTSIPSTPLPATGIGVPNPGSPAPSPVQAGSIAEILGAPAPTPVPTPQLTGGIEGTQPIEELDVNQHIVAPGG